MTRSPGPHDDFPQTPNISQQQTTAAPDDPPGAVSHLPLSALLSQTLVAFTIEFDNEFEHQMPHHTTWGPAAHSRNGPWLVSQAMWSNFMQFVGVEGVPLRELEGQARMTNLQGLERWGYIVIGPDPSDSRANPSRADLLVRPTPAGRRAQALWQPLAGIIEERWRTRCGQDRIDRLREELQTLTSQFTGEMPYYLPVVWNGKSEIPDLKGRKPVADAEGAASQLDLATLLSRALLTFALDFEREAQVPLPISANALRVLDQQGVRIRDFPRLTGVSREAISMSLGLLERQHYLVVERDPTDKRTKLARRLPKGLQAQQTYQQLPDRIEERWRARFGKDNLHNLRGSLESLVQKSTAQVSPLYRGLEPYPDGWRAFLRQPGMLPHYPMVLHRGGFPDGA